MSEKANFDKRLLAGAIDFGIAFILYKIFVKPLDMIIASLFIFFRDTFPDGKSIGKMIANLRVERNETQTPAGYKESILRNFFFTIPIVNLIMIAIELFFIYTDSSGLRLGDKIALTQVVEDKINLSEAKPNEHIVLDTKVTESK